MKKVTRWERYKAFRYHLIYLANWECQECHKYHPRLRIHHKDFKKIASPESEIERNVEQNCIVICSKCHTKIHREHNLRKEK